MKKVVGQPQFLKQVNINIITNIILEHAPITKPEIAKISGLSLPTVNKIVLGLEEKNLVKKAGVEGYGVGRKAQLYVINENSGNVLTLYFVNDYYICCVNNMAGEIIYRFTIPVNIATKNSAVEDTFTAIKRLISNAQNKVVAIGIGVPGIVKDSQVIANIPSIPCWEGINLTQLVYEEFGIPTFVENDVKLSTIGYFANNHKKKSNSMVYMYLGKGIGSGMILNKKIFKGNNGFSGEFGFMIIDNNYVDCRNSQTTAGYMEQKLTNLIAKFKDDSISKEILQKLKIEFATCLAKAIANFVCIVNPQVIVLKGTSISPEIIENINQQLKIYIPKESIPKIEEDRSDMSGIDGLLNMCVTNVSSSYNIVEEDII